MRCCDYFYSKIKTLVFPDFQHRLCQLHRRTLGGNENRSGFLRAGHFKRYGHNIRPKVSIKV